MSTKPVYDSAFFAGLKDGSYRSARVVVPHVLSLYQPKSVVDFGCGVGTWLRVFGELGLTDVLGVDGDYVTDEMLEIPQRQFLRADLSNPIDLKRTFDLVISLEVGEHLEEERAEGYVQTLTRHGRVVLFSAAVPHQGGENHVNEQWPTYWSALFERQGFCCVDCLRPVFWKDERVDWWYRQNLLLFVEKGLAVESGGALPAASSRAPMDMVHPTLYEEAFHRQKPFGIGGLLRRIPESVRTSLRWYRESSRG
ncbi:MAG: hypothetical protein NVSMB62_28660 [Acidobacteriaceae bacterium]